MKQLVNVQSVNTIPTLAGSWNNASTYSSLWIDPDKRECGVCQDTEDNSIPFEIYAGYLLTYGIDEKNERCDSDQLRDLLNSDEGQELLERICDGWYTECNGRNLFGHLDEDAEEAVEELLYAISQLSTQEYQTWDVDEWITSPCDLAISALTTDDQLVTISDQIYREAEDQNVSLCGDLYEKLAKYRDEDLAALLECATELVDDELEDDYQMSHHPFDEKNLEVEFFLTGGKKLIVHVNSNEEARIMSRSDTNSMDMEVGSHE